MSAAASHLLVSLRRACAAGVSMPNPALESLCSLALAIILRWMFSRNIYSGSLINYFYTAKHHAHRDLLVQILCCKLSSCHKHKLQFKHTSGSSGPLPRAV